jgi:hypothetical protein
MIQTPVRDEPLDIRTFLLPPAMIGRFDLAMGARQMPRDWESHYGHRPLLLETLVDAEGQYSWEVDKSPAAIAFQPNAGKEEDRSPRYPSAAKRRLTPGVAGDDDI